LLEVSFKFSNTSSSDGTTKQPVMNPYVTVTPFAVSPWLNPHNLPPVIGCTPALAALPMANRPRVELARLERQHAYHYTSNMSSLATGLRVPPLVNSHNYNDDLRISPSMGATPAGAVLDHGPLVNWGVLESGHGRTLNMSSRGTPLRDSPLNSNSNKVNLPPSIGCTPARAVLPNCPPIELVELESGHGYTSKRVYEQNLELKTINLTLMSELAAIKKALYHSGIDNGLGGLQGILKRKGRPIEKENVRNSRRIAAAQTMVVLSKLIQGPDLASNVVAIARAATSEDGDVPRKLVEEGVFPERLVEVPDKRTKSKMRLTVQTTLMSKKNGFLWQAAHTVTSKSVKGLRDYGGKGLIDTPEQLQGWAAAQPELPDFQFVMPGSSAIWTPPTDLLEKLLANTAFTDSLRWDAPYEKLREGQRIFVAYLVRTLCSARAVS